ncbi:hypothetical protein NIE88_21225 [Sporolactobacillus shoreicorticis]|uniref:Phage protein n=1 Tax=Sporolactobacillus shoreicorticis TaxID=1923877 RepID=A0ABW5S0J8_9BACL|nr:hypothetical protein [Sporolactobacillus shoreicorticis]MCO7128254.1 hypothetical protein [Sporolactobacillus shoreicorticis]
MHLKRMINENNIKVVELKKYEQQHHNDLPSDAVYWAVVHKIEYFEKQNNELGQ